MGEELNTPGQRTECRECRKRWGTLGPAAQTACVLVRLTSAANRLGNSAGCNGTVVSPSSAKHRTTVGHLVV
jgi:hypothetical protein